MILVYTRPEYHTLPVSFRFSFMTALYYGWISEGRKDVHIWMYFDSSSISYVFTVSHSACEMDADYTSIKRLLWGPPQRHIYSQLEYAISIIYLHSSDGVVVYYLKPSSRSRALNTPVTSYSSHPIILSATIVLRCGFCCPALWQHFHAAVA